MKVLHSICVLAALVAITAGCATTAPSKCLPGTNRNCADSSCKQRTFQGHHGACGCTNPGCKTCPSYVCNDKMIPPYYQNMRPGGGYYIDGYYYPASGIGNGQVIGKICNCMACLRGSGPCLFPCIPIPGSGLFGGRNQYYDNMGYFDGDTYTTRGPRDFFYNEPKSIGY